MPLVAFAICMGVAFYFFGVEFESGESVHSARLVFAAGGGLADLTLFRFAHVFRNPTAGGMEGYLWDLNRRLLERNRMRILQMYLTKDNGLVKMTTERLGKGELIWIPCALRVADTASKTRAQRMWAGVRRRLLDEPVVFHDNLLSTLRTFDVNLAVFHWFSYDSRIVLDYLNGADVPIVAVNHFENARLKQRLIRAQISSVQAVGGVSNVAVPAFLKKSFTNLSDGIDSDFFNAAKAKPLARGLEKPVILLPSRVTEGKGHLDAVYALGWLRRKGVNATLAFAGRVENPDLFAQITKAAATEGVASRVIVTGELSPEDLRDWYGAADLVVLPSRREGLGRVLLEAQAMCKPVVAYATGGITAAIREGITGHLVRRKHFKELALKMFVLLGDADMSREMGRAGREWIVSQFSLDALAERHESFCSVSARQPRAPLSENTPRGPQKANSDVLV